MESFDSDIDYDAQYGALRSPTRVQSWEEADVPVSKVLLDESIGARLKDYQELSKCQLFGAMPHCFLFLWVMDADCKIWIAFEEIMPPPGSDGTKGHPRRRGYPSHPSEEKKLGHPTLVSCGQARAAGELYLDEEDAELVWRVNVGSGRYCKESPPTRAQCEAIHQRFRMIVGESVLWDEL